MPRFHTLTVREIRRETNDCISIAFEVPEAVQQEFAFSQGQYLTLKAEIDGQELRRSYSICSSPEEKELRVAVKRVEGGQFSTYANERLKPGDPIEVMTPMGRFFTEIDPSRGRHYVAFAAGSGITPVFSLLKTILYREPLSHFTLVYGNRGVDSIIFREQLEGLKNRFLGRLRIHHVLSREVLDSELLSGRIDAIRARRIFDLLIDVEGVDEFFLCGPHPMIEAVAQVLRERGVDKKQIHTELFTPVGGWREPRPQGPATIEEAGVTVKVSLDGSQLSFSMSPAETILEAALRAGAELPFACKGGVCSTCRAKLESGEVELALNYALEDDELAAGYVLTCQSFPKSRQVEVNFDA